MSGGVDSAVSAVLLQQAGYDVHALFMRNWDEDEDGYCTAAADLQDARKVCDDLGIPLHTVTFAAEYRDRVFRHFLDELAAGRTPNPDVACNREIKFGVCFEHAQRLGARTALPPATTHAPRPADCCADSIRARTRATSCTPCRATMLARTLFPIGHLPKSGGASHRARARPARARQARQHRHLLHRRTTVCGVPADVPASPARPDRDARRQQDRDAPRPHVLHARPAPGPRSRRRTRCRGKSVVRRAQGPRAQRAGRRPEPRPPAAAERRDPHRTARTGLPAAPAAPAARSAAR